MSCNKQMRKYREKIIRQREEVGEMGDEICASVHMLTILQLA